MADFAVTPEALRAASAQLDVARRSLDDTLERLGAQVRALEGNWDGAARLAYSAAQREWTASLDELNRILGLIAQRTAGIADDYVSADATSAARFTHNS